MEDEGHTVLDDEIDHQELEDAALTNVEEQLPEAYERMEEFISQV